MEPITDTALDGIERELALVPAASSAYCPDEESSLRFHLHVLAPRLLAEIRRHRVAIAADRERVRAVVSDAAEFVLGSDIYVRVGNMDSTRLADAIAARVAEQLASPAPRLTADEDALGELRARLFGAR